MFAERLSGAIEGLHVDLDELYWLPDWRERAIGDFRQLVDEATQQSRWVVAGNYPPVRDLVWSRADTLVWLNYSFATVWSRALRRTFRRAITRETVCGGNRESLRKALLSRDSMLLWVLKTYGRYRREYRELLTQSEWSHLQIVEHRSPRMSAEFLDRQG